MTTTTEDAKGTFSVEMNGLNSISETERKGKASGLFWPWFAANVSVLAVSYGSFILGFGISFWQATIVAIVGIVISFLFCGFISLAGKRGSAPTLTLSRAAFGVRGNRLPSIISWILTVGWETVLASLAVLATATVFTELGWEGGMVTQVIALIVVVALVTVGGVVGFNLIMKMQVWITVITAILTVIYIVLVFDQINFETVAAIPDGSFPVVVGAFVFVMTGFGLGWVQAAADYSRYLPRKTSSGGVVGWTTFGASLAPVILVVFGLLLAGSSTQLNDAIGSDPIGALTSVLPVWFLVPFALVAVLGLVGGAVLDIYSSGLALLSAGIRIPRPVAAGIDGIIMILGTIYIVFFAADFIGPFQAFLITLGVPIAVWCGIFLADITMRRRDYAEKALFNIKGRYRDVRWSAIAILVVGTALGWGLVYNAFGPEWVKWQGYLLDAFGLGGRDGLWGGANLGVLVALVVGYLGTLIFSRRAVQIQEALPSEDAALTNAMGAEGV